jgi:hypothetical protein
MRGIPITLRKPVMLIIAVGIIAIGLINSSSLVYAYVTITSPTKSQQIPAGSTFNIKGTSTAANDTNHCVVSVIINAIRPYQEASPIGTNGTKDYTSWQLVGQPSYATVKLGQNKITTKYSCFPNSDTNNTQPNFGKYHSVNVTGVGQPPQQQHQPPPQSKQTSPSPSAPTPSTNSATKENSGGKIVKEPTHSKIIK